MSSPTYVLVRHELRDWCEFIAFCSLVANFLPPAKWLARWPRCKAAYVLLVDLVAGFALNWRAELPSLSKEWMGMRNSKRIRRLRRTLVLKIEPAGGDDEEPSKE